MQLGEARTPDGVRLYAIGDVHGCDGLLAEVHGMIAADLAARPCVSHRIIHLGDYVDRGPDAAGVIERLSRLDQTDAVVCLRGNHEELLLDFLADPSANGDLWLMNSAHSTLMSYGLEAYLGNLGERELLALGEEFAETLPRHHHAFLAALPYSVQFGDYFFCHAGVRPGVRLDAQRHVDLTWIREEFLFSDDDFGAVIVHGHTPAETPELRPNRINVDTGAVLGGDLTCVVLEEDAYRFL